MNERNKIYLESSIYGVVRSVIGSYQSPSILSTNYFLGLPLEHPFDSIKTKLQAAFGENKRFLNTTLEIYHKQGIIDGFYAGFLPNLVRTSIKQVYRWPMMLYFPYLFDHIYPKSIKEYFPSINKVTTGLAIAISESIIVCPLERLKIVLMTKKYQLSIMRFMKENRSNVLRSLFQGFELQLLRQIISWISFLYFEFKFKKIAKNIKGLSNEEQLDTGTLVFCSFLVGVCNVLCIMPIDMIKTLYQQHNAEYYQNMKITEAFKTIYQHKKWSGYYIGWQPRLIQYIINSFFTVIALDKLEHRLKLAKS